MDTREPARNLGDRGATSLQFLLASALGMVLFLALANLVVVQYGRGAIRSALDQGVRVASVTGSASGCEDRVVEVLAQLLGGAMGEEISTSCALTGQRATATASGVFPSWTPFSPDFSISMTASAVVDDP